jgi:hypothetical protein
MVKGGFPEMEDMVFMKILGVFLDRPREGIIGVHRHTVVVNPNVVVGAIAIFELS